MIKTIAPNLDDFAENYRGSIRNKFTSAINSGKTKFVFSGPSGSGKSFLAEAAAKSMGMSLEKINLYALENIDGNDVSSVMYSLIYNTAKSTSLFDSNKKLIYVEDIEKVLSVDPSILKKLFTVSSAVIVFESRSGDIFKAKNKSYITGYEVIRFYKLNDQVVNNYISKILLINNLKLSAPAVNAIAKNANGSLTNVLTDVETAALVSSKDIYLPPRNADDSIFEQLNAVFSGDTSLVNTHFSSDLEAKNFEIWIADKAPQVFKGEALYQVFDKLSAVDIILNKIKKQNWSLLKYVQNGLFSGISAMSNGTRSNITYSTAPNWSVYYKFQ
ncbi:MAG: AAA family ATPase [Candidatus Parvarchaeota archaeon]|jgi:DNA polymerase III delta prime subunit|nr:AAA family ATPase [Candidatus Parvarchaeota archaeon]